MVDIQELLANLIRLEKRLAVARPAEPGSERSVGAWIVLLKQYHGRIARRVAKEPIAPEGGRARSALVAANQRAVLELEHLTPALRRADPKEAKLVLRFLSQLSNPGVLFASME